MKLNVKDVAAITFGALKVTENGEDFSFERFTEAQMDYYKASSDSFYKKSLHSASMLIDFTTDSEVLSFHYTVTEHSTREFYYFDIYENDMMILHHGADTLDISEGDITVKLTKGMKRVRIYLPFSRKTSIRDFTLDDGAAIFATKKLLNALILGDSITQGYDSRYPSLSYVNLMTERYSLNYVNQAIGGERFNADILGNEKLFPADFITLAMGINDWAGCSFDVVEKNADKYFSTLTSIYKDTPIIYISPIWINREGNDTTLIATVEMLESLAASYGAHIIHGLDLVPHDAGMFSDGVHPTDLGFSEYAKRLFVHTDKLIELFKKAKEESEIGLSVL